MIRISKRNLKIARKLTSLDLQRHESRFDLDDKDLFCLNIGNRGHDLFLGYYSKSGLNIAFERYGLYDRLKKKGFNNIVFDVDTSDPYKHRLTIYNQCENRRLKLAEFVARKDIFIFQMPFTHPLNGIVYRCLVIEWLLLQDPTRQFTVDRPRLPGQQYPGLGIARHVLELLSLASLRLGLQGIINIPDHFHNAYFYSRIFYYEKPEDQSKLLALISDTKNYSMFEVSIAVEENRIYDLVKNEPFQWFTAKQVMPLEEKWDNAYRSKQYIDLVKRQALNYKFELRKHENRNG